MEALEPESALVRETALRLGFDAVGIASADESIGEDFARYRSFVESGYHGGMSYMAQHLPVRESVSGPGILPGAKSVICVMQRYRVKPRIDSQPVSELGSQGIVHRIAKFARGLDYHNHMRRKLRKLASFVRSLEPGATARPLVDSAPMLERAWAVRAGLGFVGKNGMLIRPGMGSFTVLGEVVTSVRLVPDSPLDGAIAQRCGGCDACVRACPTGALVRPWVLDARRCVSYLTIEHRGPWEGVPAVSPWLFGCDLCQDCCPYNRVVGAWVGGGGPFDPLSRWCSTSLEDLERASREEMEELMRGSPLRRVRFEDWGRNVVGAGGRVGD